MKTGHVLLFGIALNLLASAPIEAAKKKPQEQPSLEQVFPPDQMKQDLKVLRQALEVGHPGL